MQKIYFLERFSQIENSLLLMGKELFVIRKKKCP